MEVMPGYKQTEVGAIPEDWLVKQIGDLKPFITSGSRGWAAFYSDRGAPFIRITNLSRDTIYLEMEDLRLVALPKDAAEGVRTQLQNDDVLISITADIGIIGYVSPSVPKPAYINQHIALVRFDSSNTNQKFVSYFLASEKPQKLFRTLTDSGAKAGMSLITIRKIHLAFPPTRAEQEAIAEALCDADAMLESLEQLIAKKRQIKHGAMQELLTGKRRLPGFADAKTGHKQTEVGVIPGDWELDYIENIAHITTGSKNTQDRVDDGEYPFFVRSQTVERINSYSFDGEAVLTAGDGVGTGKVFHYINGRFDVHQRVYRITGFSEHVNGYFFYLFFRSLFYNRIMQMTAKSSVDSVRRDMIATMLIPLPPTKAEQEAIATILSDMDIEIAALEAKLAKYRQIKQGMMHALLTGRIRLI
ncbi:MAG: restriction endonuclease subunit S [Syntrophobacteraceae bacterium]